ncbi:MAG: DUF2946 family protein [Rhodocyclaceae bacterium]
MRRAHVAGLLRIALVAALINALVPTLSYVLARSQNLQVVEMCTSFGIQRVLVDVAGGPADPKSPSQSPHCKFCMSAQDAAAVAAPLLLAPKSIQYACSGPVSAGCPPRKAPVWPQARPRAPPLLFA